MDPKVYRAYSHGNSTRPDDVKEVDEQLTREEELYRSQGVSSEQFLAQCNLKFPLNEVTVMQTLEVCANHYNLPVTLRRCEHFLLRNSRRSLEEKMEIAESNDLQLLKTEVAKLMATAEVKPEDSDEVQPFPFQIEPNSLDLQAQQLQMMLNPQQAAIDDEARAQALQELITTLEKERSKEVYMESSDGGPVYLGRIGEPECEANLSRYLELARNTDSVPRYFTPVVLQSDDPNFVPPELPLKKEEPPVEHHDVIQIDD